MARLPFCWAPDEGSLQYDVPELKTLALNRIRGGLGKCDIVEESFSIFTSRYAMHIASPNQLLTPGYRYSEIRDLYIGQLAHIWVTDSTEATRVNVEKKIDSYVEGDLQHATEMFSALWKIANKDGNVPAPPSPAPDVSPLSFLSFSRCARVTHCR